MLEFFFKHRILFLFFVLAFGFISPSSGKTDKVSDLPPEVQPKTRQGKMIAEKISAWFPDAPYMVYIANCESTGLIHLENGQLIQGEDGTDKGVFQVHMPKHLDEMKRLGLDPNDIDDYFSYVRILYYKFGLRPWRSSQKCWSKYHRPQPRG